MDPDDRPDSMEVVVDMLEALEDFAVQGIATTIPAHQTILRDERFIIGEYDTRLVEQILG